MLTGMAMAALSPIACLGKQFVKKGANRPAPQDRLVSAWENKVTYASDGSRGGAVYPGLLARVYLFRPLPTPPPVGQPESVDPSKGVPYLGDGNLTIFIYDATPHGPTEQPKLTDVVNFDPTTLPQFAKTDAIGPGYTIFCPWFNYRPEISHLFIQLEYTSAAGEKLYHQSGTFSIDHGETKERVKKGMPAYRPDTAPTS
jgi:hypothetical protein